VRLAAITTYLGLALVASLPGLRFDVLALCRNATFLLGLTLASVALLPAAFAWLPSVLAPMSMWLLGIQRGGRSSMWAILFHSRSSLVAGVAALGLFALEVYCFLLIGRSPRLLSGWQKPAPRTAIRAPCGTHARD
jgi:hypothetical protein